MDKNEKSVPSTFEAKFVPSIFQLYIQKKARSLRHRSVLQDLRAILMSPIKKTRTFELFQSLRLSFYQVITLSFSLVSLSNE